MLPAMERLAWGAASSRGIAICFIESSSGASVQAQSTLYATKRGLKDCPATTVGLPAVPAAIRASLVSWPKKHEHLRQFRSPMENPGRMPAMITLNGFGPAFGLPDPSPFVTKVEVLLKMAGLEFRTAANGLRRAPKRKLPYIDDGGTIIADSTFIRWHIEEKYGFDFHRDLPSEERAVAWAFEKMAEEHLYWAIVHSRWMDNGQGAAPVLQVGARPAAAPGDRDHPP